MENLKDFIQKYWFYLLIGFVTFFIAVLSLLAVVKLKEVEPVAPTVPQRKPQAASQVTPQIQKKKCELTFSLASATESASLLTPNLSPSPPQATGEANLALGGGNTPPECTGLFASPSSGTAPLTVKFSGSASDSDGKILAFEFFFGDGGEQTIEKDPSTAQSMETQEVTHTYTQAGSYPASLRVKDDEGTASTISETCKVTITVGGSLGGGMPEATETAVPLPEIPESGALLPTILTILGGGAIILLGVLL